MSNEREPGSSTGRADDAGHERKLEDAATAVFPRSELLGYRRRQRALRQGEAALVVDPFESPLWYVNHYDPVSLEETVRDPDRTKKMLHMARLVLKWTAD
jgi:hypothetical protein